MTLTPEELQLIQVAASASTVLTALAAVKWWEPLRARVRNAKAYRVAFHPKSALVDEIERLKKEKLAAEMERDFAQRQSLNEQMAAASFEIALRAHREETDARLGIMESRLEALDAHRIRLETQLTIVTDKFEVAVVYIRTLTLHILKLVREMMKAGISYDPSFAVPEPPRRLIEDLQR